MQFHIQQAAQGELGATQRHDWREDRWGTGYQFALYAAPVDNGQSAGFLRHQDAPVRQWRNGIGPAGQIDNPLDPKPVVTGIYALLLHP